MGGGGGGGIDLGKGRRLPVSNILENKWGNYSTHEENLLDTEKILIDINLGKGFTAIKAQENNHKK